MRGDSKRGGRGDRGKVAANQPHEVKYMAQKLNVSEEDVIRAIQEVGNDRKKVEEYLQNKKSRS